VVDCALRRAYNFDDGSSWHLPAKQETSMKNLRSYITKPLQPKRLSNSTAALAGLASAVSVFVGILAARAAPHGWLRIATALHLHHRQPLIVKLAPVVTGIAVTLATAAGLVKFYLWCVEREEEVEEKAAAAETRKNEAAPTGT
jgi:ABC-type spermidine/putrescine transport system permease subunit II